MYLVINDSSSEALFSLLLINSIGLNQVPANWVLLGIVSFIFIAPKCYYFGVLLARLGQELLLS